MTRTKTTKATGSKQTADDLYKAGLKLQQKSKHQEALEKFNKALDIDPKHQQTLTAKFQILKVLVKAQQDLAKRESYLQQAHRIQPDDMELAQELANIRHKIYCQQKRDDESESSQGKCTFYKYLAVQGGGIKGLGYIGAMRELVKRIDLRAIKKIVGASSGAISALLLGLDYSLGELEDMLGNLAFVEFMDGDFREQLFALKNNQEEIKDAIARFKQHIEPAAKGSKVKQASTVLSVMTKMAKNPHVKMLKHGASLIANNSYGLFPGDYFRLDWAEKVIQNKTGIAYITFKELQELAKKKEYSGFRDIYFVGTNLTTGKKEIFSAEHTPDMIVSDAVRISMSIPFIYQPWYIHYKRDGKRVKDERGHLYVDGGILDNYPLSFFDGEEGKMNRHALGLRLMPEEKIAAAYGKKVEVKAKEAPKNLFNYIFQIVDLFYHRHNQGGPKSKEVARTVYINHLGIGTADFDIKEEQKLSLIKEGEKAVVKFFKRRAKLNEHLLLAVTKGDAKEVKRLLKLAADPNGSDAKSSLLDHALAQKNKFILLMLIKARGYKCSDPQAVLSYLDEAKESGFVDPDLIASYKSFFETQYKEALAKIVNKL